MAADPGPPQFYARKVVRDLLWAASSPHVLAAARFPVLPAAVAPAAGAIEHHPQVVAWLRALESDPSALLRFLRGSTRAEGKLLALGVYFAALLEFWLRFCPLLRVERLALGTQIVAASKQTLGQLKFLFRLASDDFHVEASVKFFLLQPLTRGAHRLEHFVGPHLGENLAWRVQEVARKLDMCRGESVQRWLRERYSDRVQSRVVLRGYLFYPLGLFRSTSDVTQRHDWAFHPNPTTARAAPGAAAAASPNPSVAGDHLRGWWTSDVEGELRAKALANDRALLGESRFVVLPKLHWLSPLLAHEAPTTTATEEDEEATSTVVDVVDGEKELGIPPLPLLTLSELVALAKAHFLANGGGVGPEAQASGAAVTPLLVSELVRCRPEDLEFDASGRQRRWKELSRGFALDARYWDPKRVNNSEGDANATNEREDEGRREWVHDGVVKPSGEELAAALTSKPRVFFDPETIPPTELCKTLFALFATDDKAFTRASLRDAIGEVLHAKTAAVDGSTALPGAAEFALECLRLLVFEELDEAQHERQQQLKLAQRVSHLILDAFEAQRAVSEDPQPVDKLPWRRFFLRVAKQPAKWPFLVVALRAGDVVCRLTGTGWPAMEAGESAEIDGVTQELLALRSPRWNAVAVETLKVLSILNCPERDSALAKERIRDVLESLTGQRDWKNVEHLAVLSGDREVLQATLELFSRLNIPKVAKRLRQVLVECHRRTPDDVSSLLLADTSGGCVSVVVGPAINHELNRTLGVDVVTRFEWESVDTPSQVDQLLELLDRLHRGISATASGSLETVARMVVGLDCEWRPQFFSRDDGVGTVNNKDELRKPADEPDGLSVYQLAVGDKVFIVDVQALGAVAAQPLRFIWEHESSVVLVGFCVTSDVKRIDRSFPGLLRTAGVNKLLVELKQLALYRQVPASKWGLSQLARECIEDDVDKEQQCSDWGTRPLSPSQLEYAAKDVFVVRRIALHLLADTLFASPPQAIEYLRRFAVVTSAADASFGHWVSEIPPLNDEHVRAAVRDLSLERETSFRHLSKDDGTWDGSARVEDGLLVIKTIAVVARSFQRGAAASSQAQYAAVVVSLDRCIDMQALGRILGVRADELALVDKEVRRLLITRGRLSCACVVQTLIRVFGYPRGCCGPLGLREQRAIQVVVDDRLLAEDRLLCGAGKIDEVYAIPPGVLASAVRATTAPISQAGV
ncbi:hypothetical protein PybrP1_010814 [[Pythium] brassicae (nom. inval.)]|nr:hypothetical protein PybrP1_010814 [[Pythium] brassicae (nom. inval.)]